MVQNRKDMNRLLYTLGIAAFVALAMCTKQRGYVITKAKREGKRWRYTCCPFNGKEIDYRRPSHFYGDSAEYNLTDKISIHN